jgi:hypothetical protein
VTPTVGREDQPSPLDSCLLDARIVNALVAGDA